MTQRVVLVPYNPKWPARFEAAKAAILEACAGIVKTVEHIGSTSIPGLAAKDIIDMMPGLERFEDGQRCVAGLEGLGYEYRGEFGIPGRHYFVRNDRETGERLEHLHMYAIGHDEWTAHLALRDYLRAHDEWRDRYEALKRELAAKYPTDVETYAEAKTEFVKQVVALHAAESGSGHTYRRVR